MSEFIKCHYKFKQLLQTMNVDSESENKSNSLTNQINL